MNRTIRSCILVVLAMRLSAASAAAANPTFNPGANIEELHAALNAGAISDVELVQYYLNRIQRFDKSGPQINAMITLNAAALIQAASVDRELKSHPSSSKLYGIPFIVKDNFNTVGLPTSAGSAALEHSMPPGNAFAVQRLLDRGAILIGKANMSELAASYGRFGYSSAGGLTVNPYDTARDVSGSSSGSAAALAAGFAAFALGTDTSGSIRGPANVAGLVGLRPTFGLISRGGVVPLSLTFDTVGILGHSALDVAIVLDALAAADTADAATLERPPSARSYADAAARTSLRGVRLGVVGNFRGANAEIDAVEQSALHTLRAQGATLIPITLPPPYQMLWETVMAPAGAAELRPQLERYLRTLPAGQPHTLAELIERSGRADGITNSPARINPALLTALREAQVGELSDSPLYIHILTQVIPALRAGLLGVIASKKLDALVFSTMSCPATPRFDRPDATYQCRSGDSYKASYIASTAGLPEVTVPVARIANNLPAGYSFVGEPFSEARLLGFANVLQGARGALPGPVLQ